MGRLAPLELASFEGVLTPTICWLLCRFRLPLPPGGLHPFLPAAAPVLAPLLTPTPFCPRFFLPLLVPREYTLFDSGTINNAAGAPAHLGGLLAGVDTAKRRAVIQQLSRDLLPIMEKGLVDCPLVHRSAPGWAHICAACLGWWQVI